MALEHPDYLALAARIAVSNLHKTTRDSFSDVCADMRAHVHPTTGEPAPLLSEEVNAFVQANRAELDAAIVIARDFEYVIFVSAVSVRWAGFTTWLAPTAAMIAGLTTLGSRRWSTRT
jgi:hypothetical protein